MKRVGGTLLLVVGLAACGGGGGAVCGDGIVGGTEQCDDGKKNGTPGDACSATCQSITVPYAEMDLSWSLLKNTGVAGYGGIGCADVGATTARVHFDGPTVIDDTVPCANYGNMYVRWCSTPVDGGRCPYIAEGTYTATVQLFDANGTAVTKPVQAGPMPVMVSDTGQTTTFPVSFGTSDFVRQDYTGKLLFRLHWGDMNGTCASAMPAVVKERVTLVRAGSTGPVTATAMPNGTKLDGTPAPCYTPTGDNYEEADGLPWGKYSFAAASGDGMFGVMQDVFVGPGVAPQTWDIVVPPAGAFQDMSVPVDGGTGG